MDFDELPGRGISYSGLRQEENITEYRLGTGMRIEERQALKTRNMGFDVSGINIVSLWKRENMRSIPCMI